MHRFLAIVFAGALVSLPLAAFADSFTVTNVSLKPATFQLRCKDPKDTWHDFTLPSLGSIDALSGDWNYECNAEAYQIKAGPNAANANQLFTIADIKVGDSYALWRAAGSASFEVFDTNHMLALRNTTGAPIRVQFKCAKAPGDANSENIAPNDFGYLADDSCTAFEVTTAQEQTDGSLLTSTRVIQANALYDIVPNQTRGVPDVVKVKGFAQA